GWWEVLREVRQRTSSAAQENPSLSDMLWVRTQRLMEDTAERLTLYQGLRVEKRNQLVREAGQRLVKTLDPSELAVALAEQLPNLAIPSCYLATYAAESDSGAGPIGRSRALLVYEHGRALELAPEGVLFPTKQLVPQGMSERADPVSLVALPLH